VSLGPDSYIQTLKALAGAVLIVAGPVVVGLGDKELGYMVILGGVLLVVASAGTLLGLTLKKGKGYSHPN
jgi:hypothetical protein